MTVNVNLVSPMPPKPNGIADYAFKIAQELVKHYPLRILCEDVFARTPDGVAVFDPEQLNRYAKPDDLFNFQIGNNPDHAFVLRALRQRSGVVTLHDLNLLYLYEMVSTSRSEISGAMVRSNSALGRLWGQHLRLGLGGTRTRHILLDLQSEILDLAQRVIVHSDFARAQIALKHGEAATKKVVVIPHYAPPIEGYNRQRSRALLRMSDEEVLILTSGFATKAKRFDWVIAALNDVLASGRRFRWVHAGEERPHEVAVSKMLEANEKLNKVTTITGYLPESELDTYIAAADIVINLRFPSVGESSGTLARSYSAGNCCIVSDTAAYSSIPRDRVVHIPVLQASTALTRALIDLIDNPERRRAIGARARKWAADELAIDRIGFRYARVLRDCEGAGLDSATAAPRRQAEAQMLILRLGDNTADNREALKAAFKSFHLNGRLLLEYQGDEMLCETFADFPLEDLMSKHGLSLEAFVLRAPENTTGAKNAELTVRVGL